MEAAGVYPQRGVGPLCCHEDNCLLEMVSLSLIKSWRLVAASDESAVPRVWYVAWEIQLVNPKGAVHD